MAVEVLERDEFMPRDWLIQAIRNPETDEIIMERLSGMVMARAINFPDQRMNLN